LTRRLTEARLQGGAAAELAELGLERILGVDDLISISFLEGGLNAARSVARLKVKSPGGTLMGYGTGFMISPHILLTNQHVFGTAADAAPSVAEFDFRESSQRSLIPREFALEPQRFFLANDALDCALVAVAAVSRDGGASVGQYGWNRLIAEEGKIAVGEKLNIIQHPGGQPQQVALRSNELKDVLDLHLHYETDTAPGSSGSPVFNDQWEVVALHHSGVPKRDGQNRILADDNTPWRREMGEHRIAWISNEGVRISRIPPFLSP
jgi:endonuclease G